MIRDKCVALITSSEKKKMKEKEQGKNKIGLSGGTILSTFRKQTFQKGRQERKITVETED